MEFKHLYSLKALILSLLLTLGVGAAFGQQPDSLQAIWDANMKNLLAPEVSPSDTSWMAYLISSRDNFALSFFAKSTPGNDTSYQLWSIRSGMMEITADPAAKLLGTKTCMVHVHDTYGSLISFCVEQKGEGVVWCSGVSYSRDEDKAKKYFQKNWSVIWSNLQRAYQMSGHWPWP